MTTNDFGERLKALIFALGKNQSTFAVSIGLTQAAISKTIKGESMPRYTFIEAILAAYPKVSRDWLMEGTGEMFKKTDGGNVVNEPQGEYRVSRDRYVAFLEWEVNQLRHESARLKNSEGVSVQSELVTSASTK